MTSPAPPEVRTPAAPALPARLRLARGLCHVLPPVVAMRLGALVYPQRQAFADDVPFAVRARTGSTFAGRTSDFQGHPFAVHGYYEWRNWAVAGAICASGDTIVEIGANVGTETIGFRDIVGTTGRVVAFEPVPGNVAALRHLATLNHWENVRVMAHALGDADADLAFALPPHKHASGVGHLVAAKDAGVAEIVTVPCRRLDSLVDEVGPATAVFCDAEGAEPLILRGARDYLTRYRPVVVLEASPKHLRRAGSSLAELHATLAGGGYRPFAIRRFGLEAIADLTDPATSNWCCLPADADRLAARCSSAIARAGLMPCVRGLNPLCR